MYSRSLSLLLRRYELSFDRFRPQLFLEFVVSLFYLYVV